MSESHSVNTEPKGAAGRRYFPSLARFDINFAHLMWVYDNVRADSSVLDVGCAGEMLGVLKHKRARLTGVTRTAQRARAARVNGYDAACVAHPNRLPFPDAAFDYVISFDLFDRLTNAEARATLVEIKRVLRRGGTTLHSIARSDAIGRGEWKASSVSHRPESGVDQFDFSEKQESLFRLQFAHVDLLPRDALCLSTEEFLGETDRLRFPVEEDFLDYLRNLSFRERRAFDMAMGYVYDKLNALKIETPRSDFRIFVKASDQAFGFLDDERGERQSLFRAVNKLEAASVCLDQNENATFDEGWNGTRDVPPLARLMSERGRVRFATRGLPKKMRFDLITQMPNLRPRGITLDIFLNDVRACSFTLFRHGWLELEFVVPPSAHCAAAEGRYELEIRADRTWTQPHSSDGGGDGNALPRDGSRLSVAVCNLQVEVVS